MKKFDDWNILKKKIHNQTGQLYINEREIRFAHIGVNVGMEQDGTGKYFQRPVVVIKRVGNMYLVVPMTT